MPGIGTAGKRVRAWLETAGSRLLAALAGWSPRGRLIVITTTVLVAVASVALPLGLYDPALCNVADTRCPPPKRVKVKPLPRPLTPQEAATRGAYTALGDSYSSGEGAWNGQADQAFTNGGAEGCHRSGKAYAHSVARWYRFPKGSAHWACSGATVNGLLRGQRGEPAQLDRINGNTSLVTLSVGGNDVGFAEVLRKCIVKLPWSSACRDQDSQVRGRLAAMHLTLRVVFDRIVARAPNARVIVLGYPRLFPREPRGSLDNLSADDQKWANGIARSLGDVIRGAAQEADRRLAAARRPGSVEFVDVYESFNGHEAGTSDPYMNKLDLNIRKLSAEPQSYHPNAAGYQRFAVLVNQQIKAGPGRPIYQFR